MNKNLEEVFKERKKIRDIEKCRDCPYFHNHGNVEFGCGNVLKGHGHPWCSESYEPLKKEWFEKAHIFIADATKCRQEK